MYVERHPYLVRSEGQAGLGEAGEGLCARGSGQSEGHDDGGILRDAEGALLDAADQSEDEDDGDPVHLLRYPHSGVAGSSTGEASAGQGGLTG